MRESDGRSVEAAAAVFIEKFSGRHEIAVQGHIHGKESAGYIPPEARAPKPKKIFPKWTLAEEAVLYKMDVIDNISADDAAEELVKQSNGSRLLTPVQTRNRFIKKNNGEWMEKPFGMFSAQEMKRRVELLASTAIPKTVQSASGNVERLRQVKCARHVRDRRFSLEHGIEICFSLASTGNAVRSTPQYAARIHRG